MKRALAATLSAASLLFAVGCSETPTAPDAAGARAPSRALATNPQGWSINKRVKEIHSLCTPNVVGCMQNTGSTTATPALAPGDTAWILFEVRITSPTMGATATVIDDVIKQCQEQLGPSFGCSAWGWDIAGLKTGFPVQVNLDDTVYTLAFWLDVWNISACVPKNVTNTATLVPGTPPGETIHSSATVLVNVKPAPGCTPPPPPPPPTGNEGCSPGFWKNKGAKSGLYVTTRKVNTVFTFTGTPYVAQGNQTLLQAVGNGGGGVDALLRQAVAAYLNAESTDVKYPLTTAQVVAMVNAALKGTLNMESVKDQLDRYNNLHGAKICG